MFTLVVVSLDGYSFPFMGRVHQEAGLKDTGALTEQIRPRMNTDVQYEEN